MLKLNSVANLFESSSPGLCSDVVSFFGGGSIDFFLLKRIAIIIITIIIKQIITPIIIFSLFFPFLEEFIVLFIEF